MEIKKNSSKNLENKRGLFFQLGLLVVGSLTLGAFTYRDPISQSIKERVVERVPISLDYTQIDKPIEPIAASTPITQSNSSTVNSQQVAGEVITQTSNDQTQVSSQTGIDLGNLLSGVVTTVGGGLVGITLEDKIEAFPLKEAYFPGGYAAMQRFIYDNLNYPQEAIELHQSGLVNVYFVIEKDGSISNISIYQGKHELLNKEAKRLVRKFPKWVPGESRYEKVRTSVNLPIRFDLKN